MTSANTLIQRAAELVIEFGLENASLAARDLREASNDDVLIQWNVQCNRIRLPTVSLHVKRRTCWLTARVTVDAECLTAADMKRVTAFAERVSELAERIEALR